EPTYQPDESYQPEPTYQPESVYQPKLNYQPGSPYRPAHTPTRRERWARDRAERFSDAARLDVARVHADRNKIQQYRVWALVLLLVVLVALGIGLTRTLGGKHQPTAAAKQTTTVRSTAPSPTATAIPAPAGMPTTGPDTFSYAAGSSTVIGTAGTVHTFRVAVESNISDLSPTAFAAQTAFVLSGTQSWIAGGKVRFQQVSKSAKADFTVYLATAAMSEKMCAKAGLHTNAINSCSFKGQVIINLSRWLTSVAGYGAPLATYQEYAMNHEIGRELGYSDEACPGAGKPAPVMMQQTLGLKGCVANGFPYLNGSLYHGPKIP
ncbi:MAG TPA: DUF3152 domain-containing protein, partial [Micromonosporaceae bacterium]